MYTSVDLIGFSHALPLCVSLSLFPVRNPLPLPSFRPRNGRNSHDGCTSPEGVPEKADTKGGTRGDDGSRGPPFRYWVVSVMEGLCRLFVLSLVGG